MIYISRIKLRSFKSFKNLDITFPKGAVCCFIGPNGSGKSNICDALRFGLGEKSLKALRVKKVSDLVFFNSKSASVTIYFDGDKKYIIKKAITKEGKVLYKLNDKKTTRKVILSELRKHGIDISTAHNIVAQNQVESVIQKNPKELRNVIDSVSGILEFDEKKKEALSELEKVSNKINDSQILMGERQGMIEELKEQANQANTYLSSKQLFEKAKATILNMDIKNLEIEFQENNKQFNQLNEEKIKIEEEIFVLNKEIRKITEEIEIIDKQIDFGSKKDDILSKIKDLEINIKTLKIKKEEISKSIDKINQKISEDKIKINNQNEKITQLKLKLGPIESNLFNLKKIINEKYSEGLDFETEQLKEKKNLYENLEKQLNKSKMEKLKYQMEIEKIKDLLESKKEELNRLLSFPNQKKLTQFQEEIEDLKKQLTEILTEQDEFLKIEKKLTQNLVDYDKKLIKLKEKISDLRPHVNISSMNPALSYIYQLKKENKLKGIYGTVADIINFDPKYASAIEACAGGRLFYLVAKDTQSSLDAIEYLKRSNAGRCFFIPLDRPISSISQEVFNLSQKQQGIDGFVYDFIKYDTKFSPVINYVFFDTLLAQNSDHAKNIKKGLARIVTYEGEVFEKSGIIAGGKMVNSISKKMQYDSLLKEHDQLKIDRDQDNLKLIDVKESISRKRKRKFEIEYTLKELNSQKSQIEKLVSKEELIEKLKNQIKDYSINLEKNISILDAINSTIIKQEEDFEEIRLSLFDLEKKQKETLSGKEQEKKQLYDKKSKLESDNRSISNEIDYLINEIMEKEEEINTLKNEEKQLKQEIYKIDKIIIEDTQNYEKLINEEKKINIKFQSILIKKQNLNKELNKFSQKKGGLAQKLSFIEKKLFELNLKKGTNQSKLVDKKTEYEDLKDIELLQGTLEDMWKIFKENKKVVLELENIINLQAPKQYEQMKDDIGGLKVKVDQLKEEKESVLNLINEIEIKKKDIFQKTFYAISDNFKKIFKNIGIFDGEGYLLLEKPNSPFDGGLQIVVKRDEKIEKLESFSGGQKTMLALIFVFAITMYKPSPFYILDEADASLDANNTVKVALFLKKMSSSAQFLLITHNPIMMSNVDTAFGVTKSEGFSTLVGVDLQFSEKKQENEN